MKFTFVSNYINHHQKPFCDAMYKLIGNDFSFVQTMPMEQERINMGWSNDLTTLPYVRLLYEDEAAESLIMDSDCVLFGWSEREDLAQKRLLSGRMTLRVSERLYRDGIYKAISPRGLIAKYNEHIRFRSKPVYILCAGAYTAYDFELIHSYPGKKLKWGYFPPLRRYEAGVLAEKKGGISPINIVWAGRFIPLKHCEYAIRLANDLQKLNISFHLHMIGSGEMEEELVSMADDDAKDKITFYGFKSPDEVRDIMEKCHIHLCTSNQLEGWGAVVNEGMNSGCVEIVSDRMGAVPYLIEHGVNGLTYSHDSYTDMKDQVLKVIYNWDQLSILGQRAYETIVCEWNADTAAERLYKFLLGLEKNSPDVPQSGPLSPAPILKLGK